MPGREQLCSRRKRFVSGGATGDTDLLEGSASSWFTAWALVSLVEECRGNLPPVRVTGGSRSGAESSAAGLRWKGGDLDEPASVVFLGRYPPAAGSLPSGNNDEAVSYWLITAKFPNPQTQLGKQELNQDPAAGKRVNYSEIALHGPAVVVMLVYPEFQPIER